MKRIIGPKTAQAIAFTLLSLAAITVIAPVDVAYDTKPMFEANAELAAATAFRNSSLQGAYLMMAARALGLDCGPMSGFDAAGLDAAFFPDGRLQVNFLCNLGRGLAATTHPRGPRLDFDEACVVM